MAKGMVGWVAKVSLVTWGALVVAACAPSEEDVKREFETEVQRSNDCSAASDCVVASAGCPLGCWVLVNAQFKDRVEAKARELVDDYESGGRSCAYDCAAPPTLACRAGKCAAEE